MTYCKNYCEEKEINTSKLNEAQRTLYYIAEHMKMDKSISEEGYKHFQMAIRALEQEPCEDAVSKSDIYKLTKEMYLEISNTKHDVHTISDCISYVASKCRQYIDKYLDDLQPVQAEQKTGHWIYDDKYSNWLDVTYECSCCKRTIIVPYVARNEVYNDYPFCHCGAKMVKPQGNETDNLVEIGTLEIGTTIEVSGIQMEILENRSYLGDEIGTLCLAKDILFHRAFDEMNYNNWESSSLRNYLNGEYKESLDKELVDALIPFNRDLLTDDGMKDYGTCVDLISLISCYEYRLYREYISNKSNRWWTLTAWSANSDEPKCVRAVKSNGSINNLFTYRDNYAGVSPVFLLRPSLKVRIVDKEETNDFK